MKTQRAVLRKIRRVISLGVSPYIGIDKAWCEQFLDEEGQVAVDYLVGGQLLVTPAPATGKK